MTVREFMNRPFDLKRLIDRRTRLLQSLRNIITGTTTPITGIPKAPSPDAHRFESTMARILDLESEIKEFEDEKDKAVVEVTDAITSINNPTCEDVHRARYLEFKDWMTIARELNYCEDWEFRLHRKGLKLIRIPMET